MPNWTFYPVFIGTIVSILGLTHIAVQNHSASPPTTLSELAASEESLLRYFRNILLFCGTLFAITLFGFIVPQLDKALLVIVFGALMIGGELLAAVVPARGKTTLAHILLAHMMAIGMLGLGVTFTLTLTGAVSAVAGIFTIMMMTSALLALLDKKRYATYELAFIFSSHFSIVVAALALK